MLMLLIEATLGGSLGYFELLMAIKSQSGDLSDGAQGISVHEVSRSCRHLPPHHSLHRRMVFAHIGKSGPRPPDLSVLEEEA